MFLLLCGVGPMGPLLLALTSLVACTFGYLMCLLETFYPVLFLHHCALSFPWVLPYYVPMGLGLSNLNLAVLDEDEYVKYVSLITDFCCFFFGNNVNPPFRLSRSGRTLGNLILNAYLLIIVRNVINVKMQSVMFLII